MTGICPECKLRIEVIDNHIIWHKNDGAYCWGWHLPPVPGSVRMNQVEQAQQALQDKIEAVKARIGVAEAYVMWNRAGELPYNPYWMTVYAQDCRALIEALEQAQAKEKLDD